VPFDVKVGGIITTVAGANGFDESLQYTIGLRVPRSKLVGANDAITGVVSKAGDSSEYAPKTVDAGARCRR
jgi:hypothetical protein